MAVEYLVFGGIVAIGTYMRYRGDKKVEKANERMRKFSEEIREANNLGTPVDIQELSRKYNLITIQATFPTLEALRGNH